MHNITNGNTRATENGALPRDPDLEQFVLGVLLLSDARQIREASAMLSADSFMANNREIYTALCEMAARDDSINPVVLHRRLIERGSKVDPASIAALYDGTPRFSNSSLATEIRILRDLATRRAILRNLEHWSMEAQEPDVNIDKLVERMRSAAADFSSKAQINRQAPSLSWADLCEIEFPPRETLLHEIERGEVVMCAAITDRGKTTLWRNIAISLACGREFEPLVKGGQSRVVYYLDFETRLPRARADFNKMLGKFEVAERALMAQNFHLVADCRIDDLPLCLSKPKHLALIEDDARRVGAEVVIVDTITTAFDLDNENDNAECTRVMKRLIHLAQRLNTVVVFLHHIGKARTEEGQATYSVYRSRGGSALSGASTAILNLLPDPKSDDIVTLECAKIKGQKFADYLLKLDIETRWFADARATAEAARKPVPLYDQIISKFNGQQLKRAEVVAMFPELSRSSIDRYLKDAVRRGDLIEVGRGKYQNPGSNPGSRQSPQPLWADYCEDFPQDSDPVVDTLDWGNGEEKESDDFDPNITPPAWTAPF